MDLSTNYLGLKLRTPLVVGASPLGKQIDGIRRLEDSGAAAIVLHSLFEEQIRIEEQNLEDKLAQGSESFAEALSYFPTPAEFQLGPVEYLEHVRQAKRAVKIPVIASLNGSTLGGWTDYAKQLQQAGADAIELNIYAIPTDPALGAAAIEESYLEIVRAVKGSVSVPVAVKLSPYFSNLANMAARLEQAGASGLVLFNRFYQPDIDLEALEVEPNLALSTDYELRLPMRWIAILHGRVKADLAASSGIHQTEDVIKLLLVGARATLLVATLLTHGASHLRTLEAGLARWMERRGYASVRQMQGAMSQQKVKTPSAYERAQYMKVLGSYR
ncbi:MAG: dihydroorotate dehydrogenase-like protein [Deltaproteobacteria bacterium]|nr:dihydroorotate dehydrogenase-like protein [Deltaproteobacteria bacterium]